jgi:GH24 family phage-related lysozyme (muramidase)
VSRNVTEDKTTNVNGRLMCHKVKIHRGQKAPFVDFWFNLGQHELKIKKTGEINFTGFLLTRD